ncbi:unnamed protein product [Effrenium voratum]|nr:unnamed protein product [Effrenium voratum]
MTGSASQSKTSAAGGGRLMDCKSRIEGRVEERQWISVFKEHAAFTVLTLHAEALKRGLETQQAERENLQFQVRLLEQDLQERKPSFLELQVSRLEAENRTGAAVRDEHARLKKKLAELEALANLESEPMGTALKETANTPEADEELSLARWECRRLEKRLEQARSYNSQLMEELPADRSGEVSAEEDPEIANLVAQNEQMLSRLRSELRTAEREAAPPKPPSGRRPRKGADVLTIGAGPSGEDLEWRAGK